MANPLIIPPVINAPETSLHTPVPHQSTIACEACNRRPLQEWGWGACEKCERETKQQNEPPNKFFTGRRLGDIRMTSDLPKVLPPNYPVVRSQYSPWCQQFNPTTNYGYSWQLYSTDCPETQWSLSEKTCYQ